MELRQCVQLEELSLEHNRLVRPLLDFRFISLGNLALINLDSMYSFVLLLSHIYGRAMAELQVLRLFGNPLEFLPEILPLHKLRHLSLANIRIEADENLRSVNVQIEVSV